MPAKTVKKQSKLGAFFSKLNPNSPAKKLLAFVLVFAVLGGGYYAYRSFAATGDVTVSAEAFTGGARVFVESNGKRVFLEKKLTSPIVYTKTFAGGWYICVNARDSAGVTDTMTVKFTGQYGRTVTQRVKSGWGEAITNVYGGVAIAEPLHAPDDITITISGNDTIRVRQVQFSKDKNCP